MLVREAKAATAAQARCLKMTWRRSRRLLSSMRGSRRKAADRAFLGGGVRRPPIPSMHVTVQPRPPRQRLGPRPELGARRGAWTRLSRQKALQAAKRAAAVAVAERDSLRTSLKASRKEVARLSRSDWARALGQKQSMVRSLREALATARQAQVQRLSDNARRPDRRGVRQRPRRPARAARSRCSGTSGRHPGHDSRCGRPTTAPAPLTRVIRNRPAFLQQAEVEVELLRELRLPKPPAGSEGEGAERGARARGDVGRRARILVQVP